MHIAGIGTGIVECLRIAQVIERHGEQFIARIFTTHEIDYCSGQAAATQHYAACWAAKEAVLKALGTRWKPGTAWQDIEIHPAKSGRGKVLLRGAARDLLERSDIVNIHVSTSHCRTHAMAYVIAEAN